MSKPEEQSTARDPTMNSAPSIGAKSSLVAKIPPETNRGDAGFTDQGDAGFKVTSTLSDGDGSTTVPAHDTAGTPQDQLPVIYGHFPLTQPIKLDDARPDLALDKPMMRGIHTPTFWHTREVRRMKTQDGPVEVDCETIRHKFGISDLNWKGAGNTIAALIAYAGRKIAKIFNRR